MIIINSEGCMFKAALEKLLSRVNVALSLLEEKSLHLNSCRKCDGSGMTEHLHVDGGVCFSCNGVGKVESKWLKKKKTLQDISSHIEEAIAGDAQFSQMLADNNFRNERSKARQVRFFKEQMEGVVTERTKQIAAIEASLK